MDASIHLDNDSVEYKVKIVRIYIRVLYILHICIGDIMICGYATKLHEKVTFQIMFAM